MFYICISYMFVNQARGQCAVYIYNTVVLYMYTVHCPRACNKLSLTRIIRLRIIRGF